MSYATVTALRVILPEESATSNATLQTYLDSAKSMIDADLGFAFDGTRLTVRVNSDGEIELFLPAPGAQSVSAVTEIDTALTTSDWELDSVEGRYLTRLDASGYPIAWAEGRRVISVTYIPRTCPKALVQAELVEAVRLWRGKTAGYSDVIGVAGSNEVAYARTFAPSTRTLLDNLKRKYRKAPGLGGA